MQGTYILGRSLFVLNDDIDTIGFGFKVPYCIFVFKHRFCLKFIILLLVRDFSSFYNLKNIAVSDKFFLMGI